ncbi:U2 small nuclear ribonucleoprotein auxiliary factor [Salix suchowensis]|nr:U2 small nuclear ribonucleoprotein auxiliary factor [Salix suchowensis]
MLDHCNHLSSLNPEYEMHGNGNGDVEFDFWGASETLYSGDRGCSDLGFQAQFEEDFVDCSISPRSRLQVIAEGRKKLMEMVHSMPESSYELSLKDIKEMAIQRTSFDLEAHIIKKQKTTSFRKTGDISRTGSIEKETFLIKMFIPTSLSFKTISDKTRNDSKVSPRSSMELTDNRAGKEWWVKRILFTKAGRESGSGSTSSSSRNGSTASTGSRNSSTSRYDDNMDALPSCWPIFCTKKSKY